MNDGATRVLLVEDDESLLTVATRALEQSGLSVQACSELAEAERAVGAGIGCVITDLRLPDGSGMALLDHVRREAPGVPVILMTAYADLDAAVGAFRAGAFDYLPKPFDLDELVDLTRRALDDGSRQAGRDEPPANELLGRSPAMQPVFRAIGRLARSALPVLITGPTGSGKELVARALHRNGPRADGPFVAVNVSAIPPELLESELFGHERGAFTGAHARRRGRFEQAAGGTLFLDEIGDMPGPSQTRLLRVLSEGEFYRVGGTESIRTDARIVAATHQDLKTRVRAGAFRDDLLHRLDVVRIQVPPLSRRLEDMELLASHFLARAALETGQAPKRISREALAELRARDWPGNVRELENLCRRVSALTPGPVVYPDDLPPVDDINADNPDESLDKAVRRWFRRRHRGHAGTLWEAATQLVERALIDEALRLAGRERQAAAKLLGIGRNTIARKLRAADPGDGEN